MDEQAQKHLVLGTAGHVDHGKTTLIKAMTGVNPDRLKEEQERGVTIDLGFAWLPLADGGVLGIIDVPGHERFLRNMLAGASGVDIVLLVVAADEGVMPQTREHMEILELLETKQGVVALTKCDMVEPEWVDLVEEDLRKYLSRTFLRETRIVRVSGTTGEGVPELVQEIQRLAQSTRQRSMEGPFRLPVDRVFTITGFGTVVTGTLVSGTLRVGDAATILPEGINSRVRQIQVFGRKLESVQAGNRVAVNLVGVDIDDFSRGSAIVPPGYLDATKAIDASVSMLADAPRSLTNRLRVRVHLGTAEAIGRVMVIGAQEIEPGAKGMAQIRLERPVVAARGDRFVLRSYSPMHLLGGGVVLEPRALKHKRGEKGVIERLERALAGSPEDIVLDALTMAEAGLTKPQIVQKTGLVENDVSASLKSLAEDGQAIEQAGRFLARSSYEMLAARLQSALEAYHSANPMKPGAPKEEMRAQLGPRVDQKGFQALLALMAVDARVVVSEATIRLPEHTPTLSTKQKELADRIERAFLEAGSNPPLASEIDQRYGPEGRAIVAMLVERGMLVRITPEVVFHRQALGNIESALRDYLVQHGQITVAQFRDLIGSSRKYVVPLVEYFDDAKVTRRVGDERVLWGKGT